MGELARLGPKYARLGPKYHGEDAATIDACMAYIAQDMTSGTNFSFTEDDMKRYCENGPFIEKGAQDLNNRMFKSEIL